MGRALALGGQPTRAMASAAQTLPDLPYDYGALAPVIIPEVSPPRLAGERPAPPRRQLRGRRELWWGRWRRLGPPRPAQTWLRPSPEAHPRPRSEV